MERRLLLAASSKAVTARIAHAEPVVCGKVFAHGQTLCCGVPKWEAAIMLFPLLRVNKTFQPWPWGGIWTTQRSF